VSIRDIESPSDPSLNSRTTAISGPSKKEPPLIISTWGVGWQTPNLIIICYVLCMCHFPNTKSFDLIQSNLAFAIAIAHLLLFRFIDGKEADGPHRIAPQSNISTASNILANAFGFALRGSLTIAFVQHLWHLLRVSTMKVSTIELLFSIRSNPLQIFRWSSIRATPTLCILASLMWLLQIATGFPPGAITVATIQRVSYKTINVPTFNTSFVRDICPVVEFDTNHSNWIDGKWFWY